VGAAAAIVATLHLLFRVPVPVAVPHGLAMGVIAAALEAVTPGDLDNLTLPLGVAAAYHFWGPYAV
jgi:dolichol kinase